MNIKGIMKWPRRPTWMPFSVKSKTWDGSGKSYRFKDGKCVGF